MVLCKTGFIINPYGRKSDIFLKFSEIFTCLILTKCVKLVEKWKDVCTIYVYVYVYIYICVCVYVCMYICMHVCV